MIELGKAAIERALPLISDGLERYCRIQALLPVVDTACDTEFQRFFNGFYRVRRNASWRSAFYTLLQRQKSRPRAFAHVLRDPYEATGRVEAVFASKLVASVDPEKPIIDRFVMENLGLHLPRYEPVHARLVQIDAIYDRIRGDFSDYLATAMGRYLVSRFRECYQNRQITTVKMLDLVLWQKRHAA